MDQERHTGRPDIRIRAVPYRAAGPGEDGPDLPLSASDRAELGRLAETIVFTAPGTQIFSAGQPADFLYLLADGIVSAHRGLDDGDRQVVAFYWPGDLFGLAENGIYVNSAHTLGPCMVHRFPFPALERFLAGHPRIQHGFFVKAVHDLRNAQRQILFLGQFDVPRRLAAFLIDCSQHERYFDADDATLTLPMSRYDIADYLGTSAESVTRAFTKLEAEGLLHRATPRTIELSLAALKRYAAT